jgi:hypothetical protein
MDNSRNDDRDVSRDNGVDSYDHERRRQELALRMIRHEARTCTIRECTGLTDDRIRRLYRSYAQELSEARVRRRRGKSPRQITFFVRNTKAQFESSLLASAFAAFGLLQAQRDVTSSRAPQIGLIEFGRLFCDAFETHRQLLSSSTLSFEHAWFLLQILNRSGDLQAVRCRHCDGHYLKDRFNLCRPTCPTCRLKRARARCTNPRRRRRCSNSRVVTHD